jgi:hypothetical protein
LAYNYIIECTFQLGSTTDTLMIVFWKIIQKCGISSKYTTKITEIYTNKTEHILNVLLSVSYYKVHFLNNTFKIPRNAKI